MDNIGETQVAKQIGQIENQLNILEKHTTALCDTAQSLETRLVPVTLPPEKDKVAFSEPKTEGLVMVAARLCTLNNLLGHLVLSGQNMLTRLEI
jgi:hypothetical protein